MRATRFALPLLVAAVLGCRTAPVRDVSATVPAGLTLEQVHAAIARAAASRKWVVGDEGPGKLAATLDVRGKHSATVEIAFDESRYAITYRDSHNLRYDGGEIHRNYNGWVMKLDRSIQQELLAVVRSARPAP
jgi:hypothetical protein